MIEMWLIRHGQTDWNLANIVQGQSDIPLNRTGIAQANALALKLKGTKFDAIYSSDLSRALTTANIVAEQLNLPVNTDPRLREIRQGAWEGSAIAEIKATYPDEFDRKNENPNIPVSPGAETVTEVVTRITQAAHDIHAAHDDQRVLLFSHGFVIATLYCVANGIPIQEAGQYIPENGNPLVIKLKKI